MKKHIKFLIGFCVGFSLSRFFDFALHIELSIAAGIFLLIVLYDKFAAAKPE